MRFLLLTISLGFFLAFSSAHAQFREVLYTSIPADSVSMIKLELRDSFEVVSWYNSAVFLETRILMGGCPESLLQHVAADGRYNLEYLRLDSIMTFSQSSDRKVISYPKGACEEVVKYKFYIPTDFEQVGPTEFIRKSEVSKTTLNYDDTGE